MAELSKKVRAIEKYVHGATRDTWTDTERGWLTMLATLSGLSMAKFPPYPYISGDIKNLGDVERRAPAYQLWPRFEHLRRYYILGIQHVHTAMLAYRERYALAEDCRIPLHLVDGARKDYAQTNSAKVLLKLALEPCQSDYPGEIPTRRNAYPWHSLPRVIAELPIGFARQYASTCLAQRLYSPYRHQYPDETPTRPSWPTPIWYVESW